MIIRAQLEQGLKSSTVQVMSLIQYDLLATYNSLLVLLILGNSSSIITHLAERSIHFVVQLISIQYSYTALDITT